MAAEDAHAPKPEMMPSPEEAWCEVLESYDLDRDQAEALTRIVAIRAETWRARCQSLIADARIRDTLIPPPTDPSVLQKGLELYLERRSDDRTSDPEAS